MSTKLRSLAKRQEPLCRGSKSAVWFGRTERQWKLFTGSLLKAVNADFIDFTRSTLATEALPLGGSF